MMKQLLLRTAGLVGLAVGASTLLLTASAYAQSGGAGQGATVSPALINLNAAPGGTYTLQVKVTNITTGDLNYAVAINDFRAKDETGSPQVLLKSDLPSQVSVRSWMSYQPTFHLATHESKVITFTVKVPADADPGGHYGVLRFAGTGSQVKGGTTGVALTASAGTLLLVKVAGAIDENAQLASFYSAHDGKPASFFESAPVDFITRVENVGNLHLQPFGNITITNVFGAVVAKLPVNKTQGYVLPNSIRRFDNTHGGYMFGPYTASVTVGYGTHGQVLQGTAMFWVIPWRLIGTIILVLLLIVFILRRMQKAYNKRVIKKFQNQKNEPKKSKKK